MTPPTAIIFDRPNELIGAQIYPAHKNILAPRDISLTCDDDEAFAWLDPPISCFRWEYRPWVRRFVRRVDDFAKGKDDRRQSFTKAKFVEKASIGPAPPICVPSSSHPTLERNMGMSVDRHGT